MHKEILPIVYKIDKEHDSLTVYKARSSVQRESNNFLVSERQTI